MSTQPRGTLSEEDYLAIERDVRTKHEFYRGEMFAMGGASRAHNQVTFNLARILGNQLENRDCFAYANDLRVKVAATGLYTYPDVVITCEEPRFEDSHFDTLLNPQVVIEVLSDSTEKYDRGKKFEQYRQVESLKEYILVSQDHPHIDRFWVEEGRWMLNDATGLEAVLDLPAIGCQLPLAEVYAKVTFPPEEEIPAWAAGRIGSEPPARPADG